MILDTIPPETTLHARPQATTTDTSALFSFSSNEFGAEFECALDTEPFSGCDTPMEYTELLPGEHTFQVRAVDLAEPNPNVDLTPESYTWTILGEPDTTPPDTTILIAPPAETTSINASITFAANEDIEMFECQLDAEPLEECSSPMEYSDLLPGEHVFSVWATDVALNRELEPAVHRWTVIGAAGDVPRLRTRPTRATRTSPRSRSTPTSRTRSSSAAIDGLELSACNSPMTYGGLIDGPHEFEVVARHPMGDVDETPVLYEWTVAVPPDTEILSGPDNPTEATSATFHFNATEAEASYECSLDGEAFVDCEPPMLYEGPLAAGEHVFQVRAVDSEGNVDPTPDEYRWTIEAPADLLAAELDHRLRAG